MRTIRHWHVDRISPPVDGCNYVVSMVVSTDGGRTYFDRGVSKYFETEAEAREYSARMENYAERQSEKEGA